LHYSFPTSGKPDPPMTLRCYGYLMGRQTRGRERSARKHGGRTRGDAGHPAASPDEGAPAERSPPEPSPEPSIDEFLARAQALRQTATALCQHMERLAEQMDAVAGRLGKSPMT